MASQGISSAFGGVRWCDHFVAICYAAGAIGAAGALLSANTRSEALTNGALVLWIATSWGQRLKIERLKANCGYAREADSIIKTGGTTVRVWFRR